MTSFSQNLEDSLQRFIDYAAQNNHEHVTVEHLLFSLVDDKEAYKVLKACNVDIEKLKEAGVDIVVAGSYVYGSDDYSKAIKSLQV